MDPIPHELFKGVVSTELTKFFRHNPAKINPAWNSTRNYYGGYINADLINARINGYLEDIEDPIIRWGERTIYQLIFSIVHAVAQDAEGGLEYEVEEQLATEINNEVERECRYEKLRAAGVDDDLHGIIDI